MTGSTRITGELTAIRATFLFRSAARGAIAAGGRSVAESTRYRVGIAAQPPEETYRLWARKYACADIGKVLRPDELGFDIDHYDGKRGLDTLRVLEEEAGDRLPDDVISTSRDNGSGIRIVRLPEGYRDVRWPGNLEKLVDWPAGVDIIHAHERFAMVWPSRHPERGVEYGWSTGDIPAVDAEPEIPESILDVVLSLASKSIRRATVEIPPSKVPAWLQRYGDPDGEPCDMTALVLDIWIRNLQEDSSHDPPCL